MRVDYPIIRVVKNISADNSRASEDDQIKWHISYVRHHLLGVVNRHLDVRYIHSRLSQFVQLRLYRGGNWFALNPLEKLLSLLISYGRIFGDDYRRDEPLRQNLA